MTLGKFLATTRRAPGSSWNKFHEIGCIDVYEKGIVLFLKTGEQILIPYEELTLFILKRNWIEIENSLNRHFSILPGQNGTDIVNLVNHILEGERKQREEEIRQAREKAIKDSQIVYSLKGVRGRYLCVYPDRIKLITKVSLGSFFTGNATDGEKTIYYQDVIGVQYKEPGATIGYLQLETASALMNNLNSNQFNENTFTFSKLIIDGIHMQDVLHYINNQISKIKTPVPASPAPFFSPADEILKLKKLLDLGAITEEEFKEKKKQLLEL